MFVPYTCKYVANSVQLHVNYVSYFHQVFHTIPYIALCVCVFVQLYALHEKDIQTKLDILFKKNLYQLAIRCRVLWSQ
jgi:hypothetical protein